MAPHDATMEPVVVRFRYRGGEYCLEVDPSAAARLADTKNSFAAEADTHSRLRGLWMRSHRATHA